MNGQTDGQLLRAYAESRSETAFTELVRRHIDFVYSAAQRMVYDPHLAEDVTQAVFVALAKGAGQLADRPVLSGWLHRTAQNIAAQTVRTIERRRARESRYMESAMNVMLSPEDEASWDHIAPHLDAALGELSDTDRDALFLRYFQSKSARDMAAALGVTDDAAQKRVNRAVERLRQLFAKRGVAVGASSLAIAISANAVQSAPAGLAITISAAATLVGTTFVTTTATATKVIAMTAFQKAILTASLTVAVGAGIYEANQAASAHARARTLEQQQTPLTGQIRQLQRERDDTTKKLAQLNDKLRSAESNDLELLRLRSEVGMLQKQTNELIRLQAATAQPHSDLTSDKAHSPNLAAGDLVPVESLAFAGYTTPEATFQSTLSADAKGDLKTLFEGFTPERRQEEEKGIAGKSESELAEMRAQRAAHFNAANVRIVNSRHLSDDDAELVIYLAMEKGNELATMTMKRIAGEWKISAMRH